MQELRQLKTSNQKYLLEKNLPALITLKNKLVFLCYQVANSNYSFTNQTLIEDRFTINANKFIVPKNNVGNLFMREPKYIVTSGCRAMRKTLKTFPVIHRKVDLFHFSFFLLPEMFGFQVAL